MSPQRAASPKTILLIDDDSTVVKALYSGLQRVGYEVLTAENLEQAIAVVKGASEIDLLVVDAVMPEISGPEVRAGSGGDTVVPVSAHESVVYYGSRRVDDPACL
jgi:DNA-binding NtrC family response regulator